MNQQHDLPDPPLAAKLLETRERYVASSLLSISKGWFSNFDTSVEPNLLNLFEKVECWLDIRESASILDLEVRNVYPIITPDGHLSSCYIIAECGDDRAVLGIEPDLENLMDVGAIQIARAYRVYAWASSLEAYETITTVLQLAITE